IRGRDAGLSLADCVVIGCACGGVEASGEASVELENCLIVACGLHGVYVADPARRRLKRLRLTNCDVCRCQGTNILFDGVADTTITDCRISRAGQTGIHAGSRAIIRHNAIFDNGGTGICAAGQCLVKQNLLCRNQRGLLCGPNAKCAIDGNLLIDNSTGICGQGNADSTIRRNVFLGCHDGVEYNADARLRDRIPFAGKIHVRENVFWRVLHPLIKRDGAPNAWPGRFEPLELAEEDQNRHEDPHIAIDAAGRLRLDINAPPPGFDFSAVADLSLEGRWPLTAAEPAGAVPATAGR
ncbi:MAG TPA: right-handed parallel beta-helix repeat-containing protein, partial [Pirellulales bacterium]|nr:right-handed parallel beta-helix repeat-containing protein [Pirellulales bacterium]